MGQSAESLTLEERAVYYRRMAAETIRLAEKVQSADARATYLSLSLGWKVLAENIDHLLDMRCEPLPVSGEELLR